MTSILKQEIRFMVNSFGFDSLCEFLNTTFRMREIAFIGPLAITIGLFNKFIHYIFGLEFALFLALLVLFVIEIVTGIWASRIRHRYYKKILKDKEEELDKDELNSVKYKIEKYRFSSNRLKRAGAVMGFWLIILAVIWQFSRFDHSDALASIFCTAHVIFISYIVGVYLVSVVENVSVISNNPAKFMPLKDILKKHLNQK